MNIQFMKTEIYNINNIPTPIYKDLKKAARSSASRSSGNPGTKLPIKYADMVSAFDIETTRLHDYTKEELDEARKNGTPLKDYTVMYIWQWCFTWNIGTPSTPVFREVCIYGRTWEELQNFIDVLTRSMKKRTYLVVYDHNLAYEFQFLKGILPFGPDDTFNIKARTPLKAVTGHLEFRCSYKQSNMSLRKFAESMGTPIQKTTLDYNKKRYWYTDLTDDELTYAVNDVICLCECMVKRILSEGDNLYSVPLTSTGYVRRDVRMAVESNKYLLRQIRQMMPSYDVYMELKEAFRGGNTHANRYYSNELIKTTVHSADRSSSYPAVICNNEYPMTAFQPLNDTRVKTVCHYINNLHRAVLARVRITNIRLHNSYWGCPYMCLSKCRNVINPQLDNGRILHADYLETTLTDVDIRIILDEYDMDNIEFFDVQTAKYGKLPKEITDKVIEYYQKKTSLKDVEGQEYFYMKNKNLLNSIYGMMVQDLVKVLVLFIGGENTTEPGYYGDDCTKTPKEILERAEKKGFLNYAWGVWVTSWARYELEEGIKLAGDGFIYCDTDSVKYVGNVDWTAYNNKKVSDSLKSGSHATDPNGNEHYMGVFEAEHDMTEFKTMGAKKYAYIDDKGMHITVAGVGKNTGVQELITKADGDDPMELFKEGFEFTSEAGGLEAVYNDMAYCDIIKEKNEEGKDVWVTSNVTLRPSTYTLGLTTDYRDLVNECDYTNITDLVM